MFTWGGQENVMFPIRRFNSSTGGPAAPAPGYGAGGPGYGSWGFGFGFGFHGVHESWFCGGGMGEAPRWTGTANPGA